MAFVVNTPHSFYYSDQVTCHLTSLTLYTAAIAMAWPLLDSPSIGHEALHLLQ